MFLGWIAFLSPIPPATYEASHPPKPQFFADARGSVVDTAVNYTYFYRENFACEADNECVSSVSFSDPYCRSVESFATSKKASFNDIVSRPNILCRCMERRCVSRYTLNEPKLYDITQESGRWRVTPSLTPLLEKYAVVYDELEGNWQEYPRSIFEGYYGSGREVWERDTAEFHPPE